jgi:hypothetical protein
MLTTSLEVTRDRNRPLWVLPSLYAAAGSGTGRNDETLEGSGWFRWQLGAYLLACVAHPSSESKP